MSNEVKQNVSKFFQAVFAQLTGNHAETISLKNEKKAKSAFKAQINQLEFKISDLETKVEEAEERFHETFYPKDEIVDANQYIRKVIAAEQEIEVAQANLKEAQDSMEKYKKFLADKF